jgi:hypothetical protein
MLALAIIGVLSTVVTVQVKSAILRSKEALTKANLAAIRSAIGAYVANHEGRYPTDDLTSLITEGFLEFMPKELTPAHGDFAGHVGGNVVGAGPYADWEDSAANWYYFNAPGEKWFGKVVVNCNHRDSRGNRWDEY